MIVSKQQLSALVAVPYAHRLGSNASQLTVTFAGPSHVGLILSSTYTCTMQSFTFLWQSCARNTTVTVSPMSVQQNSTVGPKSSGVPSHLPLIRRTSKKSKQQLSYVPWSNVPALITDTPEAPMATCVTSVHATAGGTSSTTFTVIVCSVMLPHSSST
ncbi:MAG: hypothetical protein PGMFKBFP_02400 [Anaerolineales bacterium]|nr:hypothetical protein [Anaerolineales bacterium]